MTHGPDAGGRKADVPVEPFEEMIHFRKITRERVIHHRKLVVRVRCVVAGRGHFPQAVDGLSYNGRHALPEVVTEVQNLHGGGRSKGGREAGRKGERENGRKEGGTLRRTQTEKSTYVE